VNSYLEAAAIKRKKMGTGFHCHVVLLAWLAVVLHCCAASDVSKGMVKYGCAVFAQQHWGPNADLDQNLSKARPRKHTSASNYA
jgi:hypothetical protein